MGLTLEDAETDRLAREISALTGETVEEAVRLALAQRLERERAHRGELSPRAAKLLEIAQHFASLPDIDPKSPDEIIGYDEIGMWR